MANVKRILAATLFSAVMLTTASCNVESDSPKELTIPVNQRQSSETLERPMFAYELTQSLIRLKVEEQKPNIIARVRPEAAIAAPSPEQAVVRPQTPKPKVETLDKPKPKVQEKVKAVSFEAAGEWMNFRASYYNADFASTGKRKGDKDYGITASGRHVTEGVTIAVDPRVIPLGTWVEIKFSDGHVEKRQAHDTGGAIKGNKVDIYMNESDKTLNELGIDKVQVRILKKDSSS